jgi:hypothetical protein
VHLSLPVEKRKIASASETGQKSELFSGPGSSKRASEHSGNLKCINCWGRVYIWETRCVHLLVDSVLLKFFSVTHFLFLFLCWSVCLSVCVSVCLYVCPSVCLSICPFSVCLSVSLKIDFVRQILSEMGYLRWPFLLLEKENNLKKNKI